MTEETGKELQAKVVENVLAAPAPPPVPESSDQTHSADVEATRRMMLAAMNKKSMALGIVLTCFFGGPGLLYASVPGGIFMTFVEIIGWCFTAITWGFGFFILIPIHLVTLAWTVIAISRYNKRLMSMI